jgi:undecaprenyl-diphosphatase
MLRRRTDPSTVTGLALTAAVVVLVVGGLVVGLVFAAVRSAVNGPLAWDSGAANWAATNATAASTRVLRKLTLLGGSDVLIPLCLLAGVVETMRSRSRAVLGFVLLAFGGELIVTNLIKVLVDRTRPDINRLTGWSGPSFPSGHAANAAAAFAALALILGRNRSRRTKAVLAGLGIGLAFAVAASRVMLGVHWLTDVVAGLALGWAWFSLSAIAFGGALLRFGEPVATVEQAVGGPPGPEVSPTGGRPAG